MKINPASIKIKSSTKIEPALDIYRKRLKRPDTVITLPIDNVCNNDLLKLLKSDIDFNLKDFTLFVKNPGKYRIAADDGFYICTAASIYFISDTGDEARVSVTKFFGLYLISCDRGENCWLEEIK